MAENSSAVAWDEEPSNVHFKPVIELTEQVETKTHEEDEDVLFKMRAKLFRFDSESAEWKERGTGDVRLLSHRETKKVRLVMRRDKTLKVCANHVISADMRLQPNIGSDRSWVWKVAADYSEQPPTSETLAIRFANSDNAALFKTAFEDGQKTNVSLAKPAQEKVDDGEKKADDGEKKADEEKKEGQEENTKDVNTEAAKDDAKTQEDKTD